MEEERDASDGERAEERNQGADEGNEWMAGTDRSFHLWQSTASQSLQSRRDYICRITALRAVHPSSGISLSSAASLLCSRVTKTPLSPNQAAHVEHTTRPSLQQDVSSSSAQVAKTSRHAAHFCIHSHTHVVHFKPLLQPACLILGPIVSFPRKHLYAADPLSRRKSLFTEGPTDSINKTWTTATTILCCIFSSSSRCR